MISLNNTTKTFDIKKSKFITNTFCVFSEEEALEEIKKIKDTYKDATHNCYAYVIGNIIRFNDDNEPSGTAGKPILNVLLKNNINYGLIVVTRYFGGIKLGANGLIRAYSKCARESIELIELIEGNTIEIEFNYEDEKLINNVIKKEDIIESSYSNNIKYIANVKTSDLVKLNNYKVLNKIYIKE